jgi:O-antigen/teichoic acid export membrane protein
LHLNIQGSIRAAATKRDVLMVGVLAAPTSASIDKVGVQFGSSALLFSDPLFVDVYALFTRWRALGQASEIRSVGWKALLVLAAVATPITLILAIESESIVARVGSEFADGWLPLV